ncbi:MAG: FTR1 family iron permease, partial [Thermoanaerobaculia bacterium]
MFEALVVTLREGVEAALVVGIIVAFLRREGEERYLPAVWGGLAAAVAGSFLGAWALYRWALNEEAFEGVLYLASAIVVGGMVVWMWRHGRAVSGEVKGSLSRILARRAGAPVAAGLALFTFLMVFREGIETVLFLSALSLTTRGLLAALGAALGLAAAVVFGVLFVRGSLRIDLGRFFKVTGIALAVFVLQLLVNGYHELSEAGWVPANATTMAAVGPLVRNEVFFLLAVLLLPLLMLLVPGREARPAEAPH